MKKFFSLLFLIPTLLYAGPPAIQNARTNKETDLLSGPGIKNTKVATVSSNTKISAGERQGAWISVLHGKLKGWTYVMNVSFTDKLEPEDSLKKTLAILGREGDSKLVSSTGTRGLDENDLKKAKPNRDEMDKLLTFASSKEEADEFGKEENLTDLLGTQGK